MMTMINKKAELESLISNDYLAVSRDRTVGETVALLREHKDDFQSKFAYLYVTDEGNKLVGVLRTRDLLIEDSFTCIDHLMKSSVVRVFEKASLEEILKVFRTYSFFAIPVTDDLGHLLGVIPCEKVQKYLSPTSGFNFYRFTNFSREEVEGKSVREIVLKRIPWLLISVTSGLICAYILGIFIGNVESIVALVLFIPIILGLAGSVGTQSAAIVNRGFQEEKLAMTKLFQVLSKEIVVGLTIGGIAFLIASLIALFWKKSPVEGIALGSSIAAVMAMSGILGTILPIVFRALKINSSFASGLFILLICDSFALILYFIISLSLISPALELG